MVDKCVLLHQVGDHHADEVGGVWPGNQLFFFIRLVTIMQTKLEVSGLANQLFFFIRLEVPPLNYSLEVDSWV